MVSVHVMSCIYDRDSLVGGETARVAEQQCAHLEFWQADALGKLVLSLRTVIRVSWHGRDRHGKTHWEGRE